MPAPVVLVELATQVWAPFFALLQEAIVWYLQLIFEPGPFKQYLPLMPAAEAAGTVKANAERTAASVSILRIVLSMGSTSPPDESLT